MTLRGDEEGMNLPLFHDLFRLVQREVLIDVDTKPRGLEEVFLGPTAGLT